MSELSIDITIRETSAEECDRLMTHILRTAFAGIDSQALVQSRSGERIDVTHMGETLPGYARGMVTTDYLVQAATKPDIRELAIAGIEDL